MTSAAFAARLGVVFLPQAASADRSNGCNHRSLWRTVMRTAVDVLSRRRRFLPARPQRLVRGSARRPVSANEGSCLTSGQRCLMADCFIVAGGRASQPGGMSQRLFGGCDGSCPLFSWFLVIEGPARRDAAFGIPSRSRRGIFGPRARWRTCGPNGV